MSADLIIFIGFLVINLAIGLFYSRGISTIKEFALGNRSFSTATIAATLVATWIDGSFFSVNLSKTYTDGLYFILPALGDVFAFLIIGRILAPKMKGFLGKLSVAEGMGDLYGKPARIITAIAAIGLSTGVIALQIKVLSGLLNQFFFVNSVYGLIASTIVIVTYSAFGGIKAVTFTDVIQLFTFGTFIPGIALIIWGTLNSPEAVAVTLAHNPLFDYSRVLDYTNPKFFSCLTLFLWFTIPALDPAVFQRIAMARSTYQISKSFSLAALICLFALLIISWIGILILSSNNGLDPNELVGHIVNNYSYLGLRSLIIIGIMAMIMSTADSYINTAAVLFAHDICRPLNIKLLDYNELFLSRCFTIFIGIVAVFIALSTTDLLELTLLASSLYMPVVTVPLILAILGFRTTTKAVMLAMFAGFSTVIIWMFARTDINSVIPGTVVNLVTLVGGHYLLKQPGGWIKTKDHQSLSHQKRLQQWIVNVRGWNLWVFIKDNLPKQESTYPLLGLFCIISIFSSIYSLPINIAGYYAQVLELIYHTVLIFSTIFLSYPMWPVLFKKDNFIKIMWLLGVFYILIFVGITLVIISNFAQFQLMIFILNLVVISILHRWRFALIIIFTGIVASIQIFKWWFGIDNLLSNIGSLQFKIMYALLLASSILISFIKPEQEEDFNGKNKFIRNVINKHQTNAAKIIQKLLRSDDKLTNKQRKQTTEIVFKNAIRLELLKTNISSLLALIKESYELKLEFIDLSDLLYSRIEACCKLYEDTKKGREFIIDIEQNVTINASKQYFTQVLDNLIINSINFCTQGKIIISLKQTGTNIHFSINYIDIDVLMDKLDEILNDIAEPNASFQTNNSTSDVEISLAFCKKVIELHGGSIKFENEVQNETKFSLELLSV